MSAEDESGDSNSDWSCDDDDVGEEPPLDISERVPVGETASIVAEVV